MGNKYIQGATFKVTLEVKPESDITVTNDEIRDWVAEHFKGCDLGSVTVGKVSREGGIIQAPPKGGRKAWCPACRAEAPANHQCPHG